MKYWAPYNGRSESINSDDYWPDGDPSIALEGAIPTGKGFEQQMRELRNLVVKSGINPNRIINGVQVAQAVQSLRMNFGFDTGSSDALTVQLDPVPYARNGGFFVVVKKGPNSNVTSSPTLNVNGNGARPIVYFDGSALLPYDMWANSLLAFVYNPVSTCWILLTLNMERIRYELQHLKVRTNIWTAHGEHHFIVPEGVYVLREIEVVGGGGGGGGASGATYAGGGGNAGSVVRGKMRVIPGQNIYIWVGSGGAKGSGATQGLDGELSAFEGTGSDVMIAEGGHGGYSEGNPGASTSPSTGGDEQYPGGQGDGGRVFSSDGPTITWGGRGGSSVAGGFGGNGSVNGGTAGNPGVYPGGGGGGGSGGGAIAEGGYGAGGRVLIRY